MPHRTNATVAKLYSAARVFNAAAKEAHAAGLKIEAGLNALEVVGAIGELPQLSVQAYMPLSGEEIPH